MPWSGSWTNGSINPQNPTAFRDWRRDNVLRYNDWVFKIIKMISQLLSRNLWSCWTGFNSSPRRCRATWPKSWDPHPLPNRTLLKQHRVTSTVLGLWREAYSERKHFLPIPGNCIWYPDLVSALLISNYNAHSILETTIKDRPLLEFLGKFRLDMCGNYGSKIELSPP